MSSCSIRARDPRGAIKSDKIQRDPDVLAGFLEDAAHYPGGFADGLIAGTCEADIAHLLRGSSPVLCVGAQSSLTGGATPMGEVLLTTSRLNRIIRIDHESVRVEAGVTLTDLDAALRNAGKYYPPTPTFMGAFVGGTIATNAAGAATFKYGTTRDWVQAITVVLPSGEVLDIERGQVLAHQDGYFEIESGRRTIRVPVPSYRAPQVSKLAAGYAAAPGMDLIDLFIGSEGTLGVIVEATLRVIPRPRRAVALIRCDDDAQAVAVTGALRGESLALARRSAKGEGGSVSAIEYMDARALRVVPNDAFARAGVSRPEGDSLLLMVQIEVESDDAAAFEQLQDLLDSCDVADEATIASPDDDRSQQRLLELREAVPASVNAVVAAAKARAHPDIEKTAGDMVVPFSRLAESIALYRQAFESRGLEYAIWGHVSDGNLHPNLIPRTLEDMTRGREAILEIARGVIGMDGAPLAEHGVGRSALKQRLLRELYGEQGIEQMRAVKRALDPDWKLAPGVLFSA
jgi:D-lactate dehydrogenase (cytochrome)